MASSVTSALIFASLIWGEGSKLLAFYKFNNIKQCWSLSAYEHRKQRCLRALVLRARMYVAQGYRACLACARFHPCTAGNPANISSTALTSAVYE